MGEVVDVRAHPRRQLVAASPPGLAAAAPGEVSEPVYAAFCKELEALGATVARGSFGADMQVALVNDGPVTMVLDSP